MPNLLTKAFAHSQKRMSLLVYELVFIIGIIYFVEEGNTWRVFNIIAIGIAWMMAVWSLRCLLRVVHHSALHVAIYLLILLCYTFGLLLQLGSLQTNPGAWLLIIIAAPPLLSLTTFLFDKKQF